MKTHNISENYHKDMGKEKTELRSALFVLILSLFISKYVSLGSDTISANQSLSGDETIVSARGLFELGFFSPGTSSNFYIGMWYKQVLKKVVVWVANRERPVRDRFSSELRISNGNLVLLDESGSAIWSTDLKPSSLAVQAVLWDNGSLALQGNSSKALWESVNDPGDTWLPGGKLRYNRRTKEKHIMTSWKSKNDPAPGIFSLEMVPSDNSYVIRWNRSKSYWSSGPWNGRIFRDIPEMRLDYIYNFSFVLNDEDNESYFTYSVYSSADMMSRMTLDVSGQIKQQNYLPLSKQWNLFWSQPRKQCEVYALCGSYGKCDEKSLPFCNCLKGFEPKSRSEWDTSVYSGGCSRSEELRCGSDEFMNVSSVSLSEDTMYVGDAGNFSACTSACLSNRSCTAYSYSGDDGCSIWIGDLLNLHQLEPGRGSEREKTLYVRLAASEFVDSQKRKLMVIIGAVAGSVCLLLALGVTALVLILGQRRGVRAVEGSLTVFRYRDLQSATKNFSEKLGEGGFGSVFKGVLSDSTVVAVKKLESIGQGEKQFRTEVSTIGTIQHVNLVRLRGFCSQGAKKLLVYDYMSNGSLDSLLFLKNIPCVLAWRTRYLIALGTARGLVYLHEKCRDCIIHCDIKPENILLDAEFRPKVADFGLAKLVGRDFSRVLTTMRGTRGYLAPEWISGAAITPKADVFSYGMMLFEIISGKRNNSEQGVATELFFRALERGDALGLLDPSLEGEANAGEVVRVSKAACWCIQDDESSRPPMSQVVQILEGIADVSLPPVPRSLRVFVEQNDPMIFFTELSSERSSSFSTRGHSSSDSSLKPF